MENKKIEIRSLDFEMSDVSSEDSLEVHGYIATNALSHILGKTDGKRWREIILPGTFAEALAKARMKEQDIDFLFEHDKDRILSSTANTSLLLEEDEVGLYMEAKISKTSWGKDLFVLIKDNIVRGLSFGMKVLREDWSRGADGIPLRTITDIELYEISALKAPAYQNTLLEARGLEIAEVEIPSEIETRNFGGSQMEENLEITPLMLYNGLTLLAEKLDNINTRIETFEKNQTIDGLEEAKQMLIETQAIIKANSIVAPVAPTEVVDPLDETDPEVQDSEETREETEEVDIADSEDPKPVVDENLDSEEEVSTETKDEVDNIPEDTEPKPEENSEPVEKTPEEIAAEEEEKKKKNVSEFRSLLETLKMEAPQLG